MLLQKGTLELTYLLNRLLKCLSMTLCATTKITQDRGQFMWQRCIFFQEEHPDIYEKFKERKHTIHQSPDPDKCLAVFGPTWESNNQ